MFINKTLFSHSLSLVGLVMQSHPTPHISFVWLSASNSVDGMCAYLNFHMFIFDYKMLTVGLPIQSLIPGPNMRHCDENSMRSSKTRWYLCAVLCHTSQLKMMIIRIFTSVQVYAWMHITESTLTQSTALSIHRAHCAILSPILCMWHDVSSNDR